MDRSSPQPKKGRGEALKRALQARRDADQNRSQESQIASTSGITSPISISKSPNTLTDEKELTTEPRGRGRMGLLSKIKEMKSESTSAEQTIASKEIGNISGRLSNVTLKTDLPSRTSSRPPTPLKPDVPCRVPSRPLTPAKTNVPSRTSSRPLTPIPALPSRPHTPLTKKVLPEETKPTQPGKPLEISQHSVESRAMTPVRRSGAAGKPISLAANFIRLEVLEGCGIFEYEVSFVPSLDVLRNRFLCLGQHRDVIGISKMFDGKKLILPKRLPKDNTKLQSELEDADGQMSTITVIINFKYKKPAGDPDCVQLFNVIYNRVFKELKLCPLSRSGAGGSKSRNYFDPVNRNSLQKHGLEVWPGYVIAVDEFEGGVQLQVDSISRVMKTQTVRETILDCLKKFGASGYKDAAIKLVVGTQVITRYNNATYKIDELDFDATPLDTFSDEKGSNLKMTEYYKSKYGITVKDENQPLLVSYKHKTGLEKPFKICLIPELCFGVGLTDAQKADFRIMKDIATFTRLRPTEKQEVLKKLILSIQGNEKAKAHLTDWGLKLSDDNIRLQGRVIDPITLHFGGGYKEAVNAKGDWGRASTSRPVLQSVDLTKWCLIYPRRDEETAKNLVKVLQQVSPKMGLRVEQPRPLAVTQDKNEEYLKAIRSMPNESQLVIVIFPGAQRADRYAAIKKLCNIERPIPSQVVMQKTLSNEKRIQAVVQKIALQMNAKLGGELWGLKIPIKSLMVIGIDVYRDKGANGSEIAGVVASLDDAYGKYYSDVVFKSKNDSIVDCLRKCIRKYRAGNGVLAKHIVIYRDGMGSGQLSVAKTEGSNFATELRNTYKEEQMKLNITGENEIVPTVTVIVVQKRLNTKLFYIPNDNKPALVENPPAGTIMDHTITHRNWYDFYMVPMSVTQGTVSPTHFTVVYDDSRFTPDVMQKLSYALTHMYFNWPGNVKVPAPCQYSHKLVELVGDHMHGKPNEQLQDKLFYL